MTITPPVDSLQALARSSWLQTWCRWLCVVYMCVCVCVWSV